MDLYSVWSTDTIDRNDLLYECNDKLKRKCKFLYFTFALHKIYIFNSFCMSHWIDPQYHLVKWSSHDKCHSSFRKKVKRKKEINWWSKKSYHFRSLKMHDFDIVKDKTMGRHLGNDNWIPSSLNGVEFFVVNKYRIELKTTY